MKIGIISDSHDHWENIKKAIKIFQDQKTDIVIHLGDYVSGQTFKMFKGIKMIGLFGNNDGDRFRILKFSNGMESEDENELNILFKKLEITERVSDSIPEMVRKILK